MVPKRCKRLAEVDSPIAAGSGPTQRSDSSAAQELLGRYRGGFGLFWRIRPGGSAIGRATLDAAPMVYSHGLSAKCGTKPRIART